MIVCIIWKNQECQFLSDNGNNVEWTTSNNFFIEEGEKRVWGLPNGKWSLLPMDCCDSAYFGDLSSVLSYGLIIWGNSINITRAFKVQDKFIRAIYNNKPIDSYKTIVKNNSH